MFWAVLFYFCAVMIENLDVELNPECSFNDTKNQSKKTSIEAKIY